MLTDYLLVKFIHILISILALGTSAGLGIVLEFYGSHPVHGGFVLRAIERIVAFFVLPGYALMLVTGLWMVHLGWPVTQKWIQAAIVLWVVGAILLGIHTAVLHRQIRLFETGETASASYRLVSLLGRVLGGLAGFVVIGILYFMVFKPAA